MPDLVLGARQYLAEQDDVTELLGSDKTYDTWIFTDRLYAEVVNSQQVAVVLTLGGPWAAPNPHNTAAFPRLELTYYADPARDAQRNVTTDDTRSKLLAAHDVIDRYLHRTSMETVYWGDVRILASTRLNEPEIRSWEDGDHAASMQIMYAVGVG